VRKCTKWSLIEACDKFETQKKDKPELYEEMQGIDIRTVPIDKFVEWMQFYKREDAAARAADYKRRRLACGRLTNPDYDETDLERDEAAEGAAYTAQLIAALARMEK
jgi:hypothetical protein